MGIAVLFPGQGSQFVGMGADLFEVRPDLLGETADAILGWSLRDLCLEGPEEVLTRTEHAQPALFALSYALWEEFDKAASVVPMSAAGHSLGEYTALTAAGAIDFEAALGVVAERGQAMADAADREPSGMAALIGADTQLAREVTAERRRTGGRLFVANDNAPGQVVVAGGIDDLEWLEENARDLGVRRVIRLKVAGAFHSPFMGPASQKVAAAVAEITPRPLRFPVYSNVTATPHEPEAMAGLLAEQVIADVRFREILEAMSKTGVDTFVHVGPGDVTAGMAKRTVAEARTLAVSELAGIAQNAAVLSTMPEPGGS